MEAQWSVDLLPPKACRSLLEVEAEIVAIFHRETPVIATEPVAKSDRSSFRCRAGLNKSSLEFIIKCKSPKPHHR